MGNIKYIIGIDEVGRGPIAGPVAVCAFMCEPSFLDFLPKNKKQKNYIRDSKKMTRKQREKWFGFLDKAREEGRCDFAVSFVSSENIDKFGIGKCIKKALDKSLSKITSQESSFLSGLAPAPVPLVPARPNSAGGRGPEEKNFLEKFEIFLDGGLRAPKEYIYQETIIHGDDLHPVISLASVVAKVSRDRVMFRYAKEFPEYGFNKHVGYGTSAHYEAIKKHGQLPIHRKTFIH